MFTQVAGAVEKGDFAIEGAEGKVVAGDFTLQGEEGRAVIRLGCGEVGVGLGDPATDAPPEVYFVSEGQFSIILAEGSAVFIDSGVAAIETLAGGKVAD